MHAHFAAPNQVPKPHSSTGSVQQYSAFI